MVGISCSCHRTRNCWKSKQNSTEVLQWLPNSTDFHLILHLLVHLDFIVSVLWIFRMPSISAIQSSQYGFGYLWNINSFTESPAVHLLSCCSSYWKSSFGYNNVTLQFVYITNTSNSNISLADLLLLALDHSFSQHNCEFSSTGLRDKMSCLPHVVSSSPDHNYC